MPIVAIFKHEFHGRKWIYEVWLNNDIMDLEVGKYIRCDVSLYPRLRSIPSDIKSGTKCIIDNIEQFKIDEMGNDVVAVSGIINGDMELSITGKMIKMDQGDFLIHTGMEWV